MPINPEEFSKEYSPEQQEILNEAVEKSKTFRVTIDMRLDHLLRAVMPLSDLLSANENAGGGLVPREMEFSMRKLILDVAEVQHKNNLCVAERFGDECGYITEVEKFRKEFADLISEDLLHKQQHESKQE